MEVEIHRPVIDSPDTDNQLADRCLLPDSGKPGHASDGSGGVNVCCHLRSGGCCSSRRGARLIVLLPVFSRQIVHTSAGELKLTAAR
jgi:hypothetical protein